VQGFDSDDPGIYEGYFRVFSVLVQRIIFRGLVRTGA